MQGMQVENRAWRSSSEDKSGGRFLEAGNLDTDKGRENGTPYHSSRKKRGMSR